MSSEIISSYEHPLGRLAYLQNGTPVLLRPNGVWDFAEGRLIDAVSRALAEQAARFQIEREELYGRIQRLEEDNDELRRTNAEFTLQPQPQRVHANALSRLGLSGHQEENGGAAKPSFTWGKSVLNWADEMDSDFPPLGKRREGPN